MKYNFTNQIRLLFFNKVRKDWLIFYCNSKHFLLSRTQTQTHKLSIIKVIKLFLINIII
jgi:hypothetical protein